MDEEKRFIEVADGQKYEITNSIWLGKKEFILAENKTSEESPFMVCDGTQNPIFGVVEYSNGEGSKDYLEVMNIFVSRLSGQIKILEAERAEQGLSLQVLTKNDCLPNLSNESFEGKLIILKPEILSPEYRSAEHQLIAVTGGNGCKSDSRGQAVFGDSLFDGRHMRYERYDVLGVADAAKLPEWAKQKLIEREQPKEKPSILAQVADKQKIVSQQIKHTQTKSNNQEL